MVALNENILSKDHCVILFPESHDSHGAVVTYSANFYYFLPDLNGMGSSQQVFAPPFFRFHRG